VATVANGTVTAVAAGTATITVTTVDGGRTASCEVAVSVDPPNTDNPGTTTPSTSVDEVVDYLDDALGGTEDDPVPLPVQFTMTDTERDNLLSAIKTAGKYVALDLSGCTMNGTEFNPGTNGTGKDKIVSNVLPNAATSIKAGDPDNPTFEGFVALKSVSGENVGAVGNFDFYGCESLKEVSFPAAVSIGAGAFQGCSSLVTVSLPKAEDIGYYALYLCTSLETVSLPAVAPTLGIDIFSQITTEQTVTVLVPAGATGYTNGSLPVTIIDSSSDVNWGNGFRGGGWTNDGTFEDASRINRNITLTIEEQ
jgi:hypothetical protein